MKSNAIKLYAHFCEMAINPIGVDTLERANVQRNALKSKAEIEERFKTSRKYKDDPEIQALLNSTKPKEEKDGKKSTR